MAVETVEKWEKDIRNLFVEGVSKVVLHGGAGTGKTWMARHIHDTAVKAGLFHASLWISLNREHEKLSLYQNIACQLSQFSIPQESEEDHGEKENAADDLEKLKKKISEELQRRRQKGGLLLLVLDDEGKKMTENDIMVKFELGCLLSLEKSNDLDHPSYLRLLISRRSGDPNHDAAGTGIHEQITVGQGRTEYREFRGIHADDLKRLFKENLSEDIKAKFENLDDLSEAVISRSKNLPAAIVLIAGALNYIHSNCLARSHSGIWMVEGVFEELAGMEQVDENVNPVIRCSYGILADTVLVDCFWHSCLVFEKCGAVYFNELISHWILEGYFGTVDCLEKVYEKAHSALMELMNISALKMEEDNYVLVERAILDHVDHLQHKICCSANLGLPHVLDDFKGLGRTVLKDGIIKTLPNSAKDEVMPTLLISASSAKDKMVSSLLIDGSPANDEMVSSLLMSTPLDRTGKLGTISQGIQAPIVLAIFKLQIIPYSELEMQNLSVLVLSGCTLLKDVSYIKNLKSLHVLEITEAAALKSIPDDIFAEESKLKTLNLSATGIPSLPEKMFEGLTQLKRLILRQSRLKVLPTLQKLENLEVLDLSGSASLETLGERNFSSLKKLQVLDFSQTKIHKPPIVTGLKQLTHLMLKDCAYLSLSPFPNNLPNLQILDISGATEIKNMGKTPFEGTRGLKVLDVSKTQIGSPHPNLGKLSLFVLRMRSCPDIGELCSINGLTCLECLDLSDCCNLKKMKDKSFGGLKYLRYLNLSNTKVEELPSLPKLENLTHLILRGCKELKDYPDLTGLKRLELLDLSGCEKLPDITEDYLKHASHLQMLNLSGTKITSLPPLCQPSKIQCLYLSNCSELGMPPKLELLTNLEVLDLSDSNSLGVIGSEFLNHTAQLQILKLPKITLTNFTAISELTNLKELSLQDCSGSKTELHLEKLKLLQVLELSGEAVGPLTSLDKISNLQKLILKGCSSLESLPSLESHTYLEVLDISGTQIQQLPSGVSELSLKYLHVPDLAAIQNFGWGKIKQLPKELKFDSSKTIEPSSIIENGKKPLIVVNGAGFFGILKENFKLKDIAHHLCKQSVVFVCSSEARVQTGDTCHHDDLFDKIFLSDVRHQTRYFPHKESDGLSIEIRGFGCLDNDVQEVVEQAQYISLVGNEYESLNPVKLNHMKLKGCWIEHCTGMKKLFLDEKDAQLGGSIETLWLSNLRDLCCFYSDKLQPVMFNNLSHLHLDCCPKLEHVFPSPEVTPNLKVLQIRFCDNLKTVFLHDEPSEVRSFKLDALLLLGLPKLQSIGVKIIPRIPNAKVWRCPNLDVTEEALRSGPHSLELHN